MCLLFHSHITHELFFWASKCSLVTSYLQIATFRTTKNKKNDDNNNSNNNNNGLKSALKWKGLNEIQQISKGESWITQDVTLFLNIETKALKQG